MGVVVIDDCHMISLAWQDKLKGQLENPVESRAEYPWLYYCCCVVVVVLFSQLSVVVVVVAVVVSYYCYYSRRGCSVIAVAVPLASLVVELSSLSLSLVSRCSIMFSLYYGSCGIVVIYYSHCHVIAVALLSASLVFLKPSSSSSSG